MTRRAKAGGKGTKQPDRKSGQPKRRGRKQNAPRLASPAGRKTLHIEQLIRERDDALEQQEASLQVLQLISSSLGDLQPVFVAILRNATRICAAKFGVLWLCEGKGFRCVALHDVPKAFETDFQRQPVIYPHPGSPLDVLVGTQQVAHINDLAATAAYTQRAPSIVPAVELGGVRTLVHVPMVKRGSGLVGAITVFRQEVRPFADKEIALLQNFAAQAVIAIENARLLNELRQRTTDLTESLEQQTATSDVLRVISSAPGDLESVFAAMLDNAVRICDAAFGNIHSWDGHAFNVLAMRNVPPSYAEARRRSPAVPPHPKSLFGALTATRSVVHFADAAANEGYAAGVPSVVAAVELGGGRTMLGVPMLKEGELVGAFTLARQEVRPFTDKQIALVTNFAAQAVIAIENARLLNELRRRTDDLSQRTTDLTEALEQQTATSEVLKVISGSPADLQPVFNAMLANATRLCEASFGTLWLCENNDQMRMAALHGRLPGAFQGKWSVGTTHRPSPSVPTARAFETRKPVQIADLKQDRAYIERDPLAVASVDAGGIRSLIAVPLLKDGTTAIGAITIYRQEVRPFTEKQIDLVANFAAQAVIAIENARLLNELRESLEQQTATSEVLKVVSSSPGDLQPVFTAMLENAVRICDANFGNLLLYENDAYRMVAMHNAPEPYANLRTSASVIRAAPEDALGRIAATKKLVQITDLLANDSYKKGTPLAVSGATLAGIRTFLGVPMLKDDRLVGALVIYRKEVRPFNEKQIALVQNFADQAVIAIENARLLSELRQRTNDLTQRTGDLTEALEQQTATSEVLEVISRSAFDLQPVFQTVAESSVRLCGADRAFIFRFDGELLRMVVGYNSTPAFVEWVAQNPIQPGRHSASARAALERRTIHIADVLADPEYVYGAKDVEPIRTVLGVPILKGDDLLGVMMIYRLEVRPFTDRQIALVETFADQAAIAIENVRLFESVGARTRELAKSLDDLRTTQDRLVQTQKLASLGQLTAGIAHEIKNPLNFVNNFSGVSVELIDELHESLQRVQADDKTRGEITELADTLRDNLGKIVQHGRRADAIVKNMLLHSREGSGEHRPVDINAMVDEALNLAYHGARAEKPDFAITLRRLFDPEAGQAEVFPQDITRVLLNLIANGFYAATKRKGTIGSQGYEPTVAAMTRSLGDRVEIGIRDNGTGMPPDVKEKMFNPFFTTKPAGEGTGLGLSISHDIIVKQHAGSIEVDTQPGEFTEIRIILPRS